MQFKKGDRVSFNLYGRVITGEVAEPHWMFETLKDDVWIIADYEASRFIIDAEDVHLIEAHHDLQWGRFQCIWETRYWGDTPRDVKQPQRSWSKVVK